MKIPEEILAERFHQLGLGIYDENGVDGNIYIDNIPSLNKDDDFKICIYKSGSFERELKVLGGAIHPMMSIYVKGKDLISTSRFINNICNVINEDSYKTDEFIVYQTFVYTEPLRLKDDEKGNYIYSCTLLMCIGYIK